MAKKTTAKKTVDPEVWCVGTWPLIIWLVVTGTMEFYDFPIMVWEFHHPT